MGTFYGNPPPFRRRSYLLMRTCVEIHRVVEDRADVVVTSEPRLETSLNSASPTPPGRRRRRAALSRAINVASTCDRPRVVYGKRVREDRGHRSRLGDRSHSDRRAATGMVGEREHGPDRKKPSQPAALAYFASPTTRPAQRSPQTEARQTDRSRHRHDARRTRKSHRSWRLCRVMPIGRAEQGHLSP